MSMASGTENGAGGGDGNRLRLAESETIFKAQRHIRKEVCCLRFAFFP